MTDRLFQSVLLIISISAITTVENDTETRFTRNNTEIKDLTEEEHDNQGVNKTDDFSYYSSDEYPYRICSMSKSTDILRFDKDFDCGHYNPKAEQEEGILIVYKENIVAHTFPVRTYKKEVTSQDSYNTAGYSVQLYGKSIAEYPLPFSELDQINTKGTCKSTASFKRTYNRWYGKQTTTWKAFHKDTSEYDMELMPLEYESPTTRRYVTVKDPYLEYGSLWTYYTSTSVNCIVTDTEAKSKYPFEFFALATGETIECSPFFDFIDPGAANKICNEELNYFRIFYNYKMLSAFGKPDAEMHTYDKVAVLQKGNTVFTWEIKNENTTICLLKLWTTVKHAIRSKTSHSMHFMAKELTSSFVVNTKQINITDVRETCALDDVDDIIRRIYESDYNETHYMNKSKEIYRSTGDLILVWQPLTKKTLYDLQEHIRTRRDTLGLNTKRDITYAQVQFLYDSMKDSINTALRQLSESWCEDQKRTIGMLYELSKINPSGIVSMIYGQPVTAKFMGDVFSVSKCSLVDQESVKLLKDMKVYKDGLHLDNQCYIRPVVTYTLPNSTAIQYGQLGMDNEILIGNYRMETCESPNTRIFIAGRTAHIFQDYVYKNSTNITNIQTLDAFIGLHLTPLENIDFQLVELYTRDELSRSNVVDLTALLREYNNVKASLYIMRHATHTPPASVFWQNLFSGLGEVGKAVGKLIGIAADVITDVVGGIVSFIKNPFGSTLLIIGIVIVVIIVLYLFLKFRTVMTNPIQQMFQHVVPPPPNKTSSSQFRGFKKLRSVFTSQDDEDDAEDDISNEDIEGTEYTEDDAIKMIKALNKLEIKRKKKEEEKKQKKPSIFEKLIYKGYTTIPNDDQ